jgi:hypothetical protein
VGVSLCSDLIPVGASLLAMDVNDKAMPLEESARLDDFREQSTGLML